MGSRMNFRQQKESKPRLLCVDDNARFLEPFASLLQLCGYAVVTSDDPRAAIVLAASTDLDLAILDSLRCADTHI